MLDADLAARDNIPGIRMNKNEPAARFRARQQFSLPYKPSTISNLTERNPQGASISRACAGSLMRPQVFATVSTVRYVVTGTVDNVDKGAPTFDLVTEDARIFQIAYDPLATSWSFRTTVVFPHPGRPVRRILLPAERFVRDNERHSLKKDDEVYDHRNPVEPGKFLARGIIGRRVLEGGHRLLDPLHPRSESVRLVPGQKERGKDQQGSGPLAGAVERFSGNHASEQCNRGENEAVAEIQGEDRPDDLPGGVSPLRAKDNGGNDKSEQRHPSHPEGEGQAIHGGGKDHRRRVSLVGKLQVRCSGSARRFARRNAASRGETLDPARGGITAPIASATGVDQLNERMKSTELKLDPSAIDLLNRASA
jgi:hypothetical protein